MGAAIPRCQVQQSVVGEKVVTHRGRTNDEERVVIDSYLPSIEAGRLALSQRVNRVTTMRGDGDRPSKKPQNAILPRRASSCE